MRLYSGTPFWLMRDGLENEQPGHPNEFPAGEEFDVAIIGAGLTGALVADAVSAEGQKVVVVDRRAAGCGSTAATTALVTYEIDVELTALVEKIGTADAVRAYQLSVAAVAGLGRIAASLESPSGYQPRPSLYLASHAKDVDRLQREADLRQRNQMDADFWSPAQVEAAYGFPSHGAVRTDCAAVVDPIRLTRGLLARARAAGAQVWQHTQLQQVASSNGGLRLTTDRGTFHAGRVVYATGYETPEALRPDITQLHSTYAIATNPLENFGPWRDECLVWETARPYFYMRTTEDGRILAGGADTPFSDADRRDRLLPEKTRVLEERLGEFLPDVATTTALSWAGTFAETPDGLPFIGPSDGCRRSLFALGYGGNGVTFGFVAAMILRDLCLGWPNDDARLFRLDR